MIRPIRAEDKETYLKMAEEFYKLDVVEESIPQINFLKTFDELMEKKSYADCLICERNGEVCGYLLLAKTFSQEAGGICWWLEELYVVPKFRNSNVASEFFDYIFNNKPEHVKRLRLEVEGCKRKLVSLYQSKGFSFLGYDQMKIDF